MRELLEAVSIWDAAAVAVAFVAVAGFVRKAWPVAVKLKDLIDDFAGEPARKGVPARPGLMERMAEVERATVSAEYHSRPNGGGSAYDALMREVRGLHGRLDEVEQTIEGHITLSNAERAALRSDVDVVLLKKSDTAEELDNG